MGQTRYKPLFDFPPEHSTAYASCCATPSPSCGYDSRTNGREGLGVDQVEDDARDRSSRRGAGVDQVRVAFAFDGHFLH